MRAGLVAEQLKSVEALSGAKLFFVFGRAYRSLVAYAETGITARGVYLSDFAVLEALLHKGPLTMTALAQSTPLKSGSLTPTIDRLETLGLVRPRHARGDERSPGIIELTPPGRKLITDVYQAHTDDIERMLAPLSPLERLALYRASKKVGLHSEQLQLARFKEQRGGLSAWQLRRATSYLTARVGEPASVAEVAARLGLSPSQFSRAFKASTGVPPYRWQLNFRIAKAQELLRYGGFPLAQIALATGFTEQSHFTRVFQKIVGASPGAWQRDHRR
jgi:AraC family transcriptional regulator